MDPKEAAQAKANEIWAAQPKTLPTGERIALIVLELKELGLPSAHVRYMGGGGDDEWEWWEDEDQV